MVRMMLFPDLQECSRSRLLHLKHDKQAAVARSAYRARRFFVGCAKACPCTPCPRPRPCCTWGRLSSSGRCGSVTICLPRKA